MTGGKSTRRGELTAERLREVLSYDPETGGWVWVKKPSPKVHVSIGDAAGCVAKDGYRVIRIDGVSYRSARLAYLYQEGTWPPDQVDHHDLDKANDRWSNLRAATCAQNLWNRPVQSNNQTRIKGAHKCSHRSGYASLIWSHGRRIYLGYYATPEAAHAAYAMAAAVLRGDFARVA